MFFLFFFFFNDTATTEIYTLSLHDALPISAPFARDCGTGVSHALTTHFCFGAVAGLYWPGADGVAVSSGFFLRTGGASGLPAVDARADGPGAVVYGVSPRTDQAQP